MPVVSTAEMGTKDILVDGKGALLAKEDITDFSNKVIKILNDPQLKEILSREGGEYAQAWKPCEMANRVLRVYQQLLTNKACVTKPHHAC